LKGPAITYEKQRAMKSPWVPMLLAIFSLFACSRNEDSQLTLKPKVFAMTVSDMDKSMEWYTEKLKFEQDTIVSYPDYGLSVGMLHQDDFFLELVLFDSSQSISDLQLPNGKTELNGFFKMGFQTNQIVSLYNGLKNQGVDIVAPLDQLPPINNYPWPKEYFLVSDPDGNYIQFFSTKEGAQEEELKIRPFLMGLATSDIDSSISWYTKHLNATIITPKVGQSGNERILLDINGFIVEIGQFEAYTDFKEIDNPDSLSNTQIHGIKKLSFVVSDIEQLENSLKSKGVVFDFPLSSTNNSMVGKEHFMIQDYSGNSLQVFSTHHN